MSRYFLAFATLMVPVVTPPSSAAVNTASTSLYSASTISIDGLVCDRALSWEGGDLRGTVVTQSLPGGTPTKAVGNSSVAPLVLQVAFPPSTQLLGLINELCEGQTTKHVLRLTDYDSTSVATETLELNGAVLMEVTFPAFDASSSGVGPVKLVFNAEQSAPVASGADKIQAPVSATAATFQLAIDGVDGRGVQRIEALTVSRRVSSGAAGSRLSSTTYTPPEFSNLRVTMSAATSTSWKTWFADFVVKGSPSEKSGSLTLIGANGAPVNAALNFRNLGILSVSRPAAAKGQATAADVEMYLEGLSLSVPSAGSSVATATNASTAADPSTPAAAASPSPTQAKIAPVGTTSKFAPIATKAPRTAVTNTSGLNPPLTTAVEPVTATATAPTAVVAAVATNPTDQGSRDPATFPRVAGLTRVSFSGTYQKNYTSEGAEYTATDAIYTLVGRVEAAAKAAGWTMTTMEEGAISTGKSVYQSWTAAPATASLSYRETETGGTKLSLQVYMQIPN